MRVLAIDGPSGAGKSTVARAVASALGWRYLDTGALYRLITLAAIREGVDVNDGRALDEMTQRILIRLEGARAFIGDEDATDRIRADDVTSLVSTVAAHPEVRAALIEHQRMLASDGDVVIEGRDIGSTVVPAAQTKVFLTASLEERARRRAAQEGSDLARVKPALEDRDKQDAERAVSPLTKPEDAIVLDTTEMTFDEVVAAIVELVGVPR